MKKQKIRIMILLLFLFAVMLFVLSFTNYNYSKKAQEEQMDMELEQLMFPGFRNGHDFLPRFFRPSGVVGASRSDRLPISCNDASISARSEFLIVDGRCAARDIAGEDNGFGNSA